MKILAFLAQADMTDYNMKMGETLGAAIFILLIILGIGLVIRKVKK